MVSLNIPYRMVKLFLGSFSIAIIVLTLNVCEAKDLIKNPPQTSLNPKSYHSLNTHILDEKNSNDFFLPHYNISIQDSLSAVSKSSKVFNKNGALSQVINGVDKNMQSASASCRELLSLASYNLNLSLPAMGKTLVDMKTTLCGAMAYIETCLDAFKYAPKRARNMVAAILDSSRKNVSNSLSILSSIDDHYHDSNLNAWPPSWMSAEERKLLLDSIKETANVKVAQDGSGRFKTISEAINIAPEKSWSRFVIYVKQGKYYENVKIDENKWNIVIVGDGMDKSIVSGKLSYSSGASTAESATFAVYGQGFIAKDMGFENTAGPWGNQAVAFLSASDKSVMYQCSMSGYQDTVCPLSGRQFYRDCRISGTVDIIFGFSSAVFQGCTILVRKPIHGQFNTITANGKSDPYCPSAFSFHKSSINKAEDLDGARTFLGRPWRQYATVVFMNTYLGPLIDPLGWTGWNIGEALPSTVYYGEFWNNGKGSKAGRAEMSVEEANRFTVSGLIGGDQWLPPTGVPYVSDL